MEISLGSKLRAWSAKQSPEKESANAVRDRRKCTEISDRLESIFEALVISRSDDASAKAVSFFTNFDKRPMSAEKKIIYDAMNIEDSPASFIDFAILNICRELLRVFWIFSFLILNKIPIKTDASKIEIYKIKPHFMLLYIPTPIPEITNAKDGLLEKPISRSSSFLLKFLSP
jgi:hypothetical protein